MKFECIDSTSEFLKRIPFRPFLFAVADLQRSGKGRKGKRWISPAGKGLYLSGMFPPLPPRLSLLAGLAMGVAVVKVLLKLSPSFALKWPNDVILCGKKAGGILTESGEDRLVVGVGINLYHSREELEGTDFPATSLALEGIKCEKEKILKDIIESLVDYYGKVEREDFSLEEFERYCPMKGKKVRILEGESVFSGKVLGFDTLGYMLVETESGIKRVSSADVSVRPEDLSYFPKGHTGKTHT